MSYSVVVWAPHMRSKGLPDGAQYGVAAAPPSADALSKGAQHRSPAAAHALPRTSGGSAVPRRSRAAAHALPRTSGGSAVPRRSRAAVVAAFAVLLSFLPGELWAANPTMSDDFTKIIGWLTSQTAQSLGFNAGSTFDPPNEMRPWRVQPDISLGIGVMPFDKSLFPKMDVQALAEKDPAGDLPDDVKFPNLTFHMRLGLPQRMDLGLRLVNMTVPKGHKLSPTTTGEGQSNTIGVGLRRHFLGGEMPLVTLGAAYNHVSGYFNFMNKFNDVELAPGFFASSTNQGQMDWDVQSLGVNCIVSQVYGKWTPFVGAGYNRTSGQVDGRLEANWKTPLIKQSVGIATNRPEPDQTRLLFGFQRDGSFMHFFLNGEVKASGFQAGRAFVFSTGLAAPFKIGANSNIVRGREADLDNGLVYSPPESRRGWRIFGRRKPNPEPELMLADEDLVPPSERSELRDAAGSDAELSHKDTRLDRYWIWGESSLAGQEQFKPRKPGYGKKAGKKTKPSPPQNRRGKTKVPSRRGSGSKSPLEPGELILIR